MTPQSIGRTSTDSVIGKHSGRNAVRNKFESMGYKLDATSSSIWSLRL